MVSYRQFVFIFCNYSLKSEVAQASVPKVELVRTPMLMSLFSEVRKPPLLAHPTSSQWTNSERSEPKLKAITSRTLSSSQPKKCLESRRQPLLKLRTNLFRKRHSMKSRKMLLWPNPRHVKQRCWKWTLKEHPRSSQPNGRLKKKLRRKHFFLRLRKNLMKILMTLNI